MIPQAELAYDVPGNYSAVCADTKVASMLTAITNAGGTAKCYSNKNSTYGDVYLRWGASSHLNSDSTQNFSVDPMGVVTWDTIYSPDTTMTWDNANIFCASKNGHLPSLEELKALYDSYDDGTGTHPTPSFSSIYWTSTIVPSFPSNANYVNMSTGVVGYPLKSALLYVRCVH